MAILMKYSLKITNLLKKLTTHYTSSCAIETWQLNKSWGISKLRKFHNFETVLNEIAGTPPFAQFFGPEKKPC